MDRIQSVSAMKNSISSSWTAFIFGKENKFEDEALCTVGMELEHCLNAVFSGCWVIQTYMDKVPSFSERRLTYEIFSNVKAGRCNDCVFQRMCVYTRAEGWLYTWLKGNIVAVESLLFLRDGFLYTKQPGERQGLNRQEAMLESVLAYRNTSCVDDHLSRNDRLKAICALTWKSNILTSKATFCVCLFTDTILILEVVLCKHWFFI